MARGKKQTTVVGTRKCNKANSKDAVRKSMGTKVAMYEAEVEKFRQALDRIDESLELVGYMDAVEALQTAAEVEWFKLVRRHKEALTRESTRLGTPCIMQW